MEKSIIQKEIEYFASKYSLIELFHSIWMNYSVLKAGNEPQKKKKALNIISTVTKRLVIKNGMQDFQIFYF